MTRPNLVRFSVLAAVLSLALPLAAHASSPGPVTPHPAPADTMTKLDKAKSERPAPAPKKKLRERQANPQPSARPDFLPDQPWETEFYVENDISARRMAQFALASFTPRP